MLVPSQAERGQLILPLSFPHKQYVRFARNRFRRYGGLRTDHRHFHVWQKLKRTNLNLAYPTLGLLYSDHQGRPARDPVCMLRSCIAMECGVTSFDLWVQMLHDETLYAIISAGDGSKLPTWADARGKKLCSCDNRGKKPEERCSCHRAYRDPLVLWGWDNYRKCWVYGHSFYELTSYSSKRCCQLPLVIFIADCNRHDSVHALATFYHAQETFGFPIQVAYLDAAHDTLGYFRLTATR